MIDETGKAYGKWTVLQRVVVADKRGVFWLCRCSCGTVKPVQGIELRRGNSTSCGCSAHDRITDLTGRKFGKLTVLGLARRSVSNNVRKYHWLCVCECGRVTTPTGSDLKRRDKGTKACRYCANTVHGHTAGRNTNGGRRTSSEFNSWRDMLLRCYNPRFPGFKNWGGRGIMVCDRWRSFSNFLADMGLKPSPRHSVERENNDGNYEPGNCVWATAVEQRANQRNSPVSGAAELVIPPPHLQGANT